MAALPDRPPARATDLRNVGAGSLAPILEEQTEAWKRELNWDFSATADLVRRYVYMQALSGYALICDGLVCGYAYYVYEESKGLIGDLYVLKSHRSVENENTLIEACLGAMWKMPGLRRVESQLMMLTDPLARSVPYSGWFQSFPRCFLEAPAVPLPPHGLPRGIEIGCWTESLQEATGRLITAAYEGHIDGRINDQYRSASGARRFLTNIVQYPGCGSFYGPASFAATDGGKLCGVSLASMVASEVGHITQVCVAPSYRSIGLGYELMRNSIWMLKQRGCRAVSLTVTAANEPALRLYRNMGFVNKRNFAAYVWEPTA